MNIKNYVDRFETKYEEGFTREEILRVLNDFPKINKKIFFETLNGSTGIVKDDNFITYHCDIETAINCGIENVDENFLKFD